MIYDTVIIGGGPAGSTFARQIASKGKSVLLIDAQTDNHKKPCGGLLAPDAQKALAYFDLVLPKSVLVDPQIFTVKTIDLYQQKIRYYQRYYLNMDRYKFDKWLISLIPNDLQILNGRCINISKDNGIFNITINRNGVTQYITTRSIVGADGAGSIVRKTFFKDSVSHYVSIQQWFKNTNNSNPFYSCIFDQATSESCSWLMHKDNNVIFGGCFTPKDCRKNFDKQKDNLIKFLGNDLGNLIKTEACITYRPKKARDFITGKNSVYLIGEAAGFISSSSFEGISSAIISGTLLGDAFNENTDDKKIAKAYHRKTFKLRLKLSFKIIKHIFMYTPFIRKLILTTGIGSIKVKHN